MIILDAKKARGKFRNWKQQNYKYFLRRFHAQGGICPLCKQRMVLGKGLTPGQQKKHAREIATLDHKVALKNGGDAIDWNNLRLICFGCNQDRDIPQLQKAEVGFVPTRQHDENGVTVYDDAELIEMSTKEEP